MQILILKKNWIVSRTNNLKQIISHHKYVYSLQDLHICVQNSTTTKRDWHPLYFFSLNIVKDCHWIPTKQCCSRKNRGRRLISSTFTVDANVFQTTKPTKSIIHDSCLWFVSIWTLWMMKFSVLLHNIYINCHWPHNRSWILPNVSQRNTTYMC